MGIPKGTKRKKWTFEEKLRIVNRYFNEHLGIKRLAKEENMDYNLFNRWIQKYMENQDYNLRNILEMHMLIFTRVNISLKPND